jgi:hypothetical protein
MRPCPHRVFAPARLGHSVLGPPGLTSLPLSPPALQLVRAEVEKEGIEAEVRAELMGDVASLVRDAGAKGRDEAARAKAEASEARDAAARATGEVGWPWGLKGCRDSCMPRPGGQPCVEVPCLPSQCTTPALAILHTNTATAHVDRSRSCSGAWRVNYAPQSSSVRSCRASGS